MAKQLNLERVKAAMDWKGVNAAKLARELDVSREAVSRWLQGIRTPSRQLLRLALKLDLQFDQVIVRLDNDSEPVIAFPHGRLKLAIAVPATGSFARL